MSGSYVRITSPLALHLHCPKFTSQGALATRAIAKQYGVPVILHTDHCQRSWLPWFDGLMDANEEYFKKNGEPLFSSHMLDLSEEYAAAPHKGSNCAIARGAFPRLYRLPLMRHTPFLALHRPLEENVGTCVEYLTRMAKSDILLEMELGVTGGEEDGVDNSDVDSSKLYTQAQPLPHPPFPVLPSCHRHHNHVHHATPPFSLTLPATTRRRSPRKCTRCIRP